MSRKFYEVAKDLEHRVNSIGYTRLSVAILGIHRFRKIKKIIDTELTKREKTLISHRFGLEGEAPKSLEVVGETLGVTRERIRQLEKQIISKLRNKLL